MEGGALAWGAFYCNFAVVGCEQGAGDGEAHAGAVQSGAALGCGVSFAAVELVEDVREVGGGYAWAVV